MTWKHKWHSCMPICDEIATSTNADCICFAGAQNNIEMEASWWCCRAKGGQCDTIEARLPTTRIWEAHPSSQPALSRRPTRFVPQQEGLRHLKNPWVCSHSLAGFQVHAKQRRPAGTTESSQSMISTMIGCTNIISGGALHANKRLHQCTHS